VQLRNSENEKGKHQSGLIKNKQHRRFSEEDWLLSVERL